MPNTLITVDSVQHTETADTGTSFSWGHFCGGPDRYLLVFLGEDGSQVPSSNCTYNGVEMTEMALQLDSATGYRLNVYGLINPDPGNNTITVNYPTAGQGLEAVSVSFNNVHQVSPFADIQIKESAGALTVSQLMANYSNSLVVDAVVWNNTSFPASASAGPQQTFLGGGQGVKVRTHVTYEGGSASITMSRAFNAATNLAYGAISLIATPEVKNGVPARDNLRARSQLPPQRPPDMTNPLEWFRLAQNWMREVNQGHLDITGNVTLNPLATSTDVADSRVAPFSFIGLMPVTQKAASAYVSGSVYISNRESGLFTIAHPASSSDEKTFVYFTIG